MGRPDVSVAQSMTPVDSPPRHDELEITVFGPGYGESIVLHMGDGIWIVVDSCIDKDGQPQALEYLRSLGVAVQKDVRLVIATHWHDDHIRGISKLFSACTSADFCCASAFCQKEFLTVIGALENGHRDSVGFGVREIHDIFTQLKQTKQIPKFAIVNRQIFHRGPTKIWALSPHDDIIIKFLQNARKMLPNPGQSKKRISTPSPNMTSVVLWVTIGDVAFLLGADLERQGWQKILACQARPRGNASFFKIPHHGSKNADVPDVWKQMLTANPYAVLTPWMLGKRSLPKKNDVSRIRAQTPNAYSTAKPNLLTARPRQAQMVSKTIRESQIKLRKTRLETGRIRMRRPLTGLQNWQVETTGFACHLQDILP